MGGTCSNAEDDRNKNINNERLLYNNNNNKNIDDEEKEFNDKQEIDAMAKEVILLSTRNANLEQELDETNRKIQKLRKGINLNVDNKSLIDILKICKILNIKISDIVIIDDENEIHDEDGLINKETKKNNKNNNNNNNKKQQEKKEKYNIYIDILEKDKNENNYLLFDKFNNNQQLYKLLNYLKKSKKDLKNVNKVIIMQLYYSYYIENIDDQQQLNDIYNFCISNFTNISTENVNQIHDIIKQEIRLKKQYETEIF